MKTVLIALSLLLTGCAKHTATVTIVVPPELQGGEMELAQAELAMIEKKLPLYTKDDLSRYEELEIEAVEDDLAAVHEAKIYKFCEAVDQLEADWKILVGLDKVLQKEHLI